MKARQASMVADLDELRELLREAERPKVKALIQSRIAALEAQLGEAADAKPSVAPAAVPAPCSSTFDKYSWDQTDSIVKVFVFHDELSKSLPTDKIDCIFKQDSFNLTVDCKGGKRSLSIRLKHSINPETSKCKLGSGRVTLHLSKLNEGEDWTALD